MVDRPLADVRPVGPIMFESDSDSEQSEEDGNTGEADDPVLETAEKWYDNITKEGNKRKMMRNYLLSVTDLTPREVDDKLEESGL